MDQTKKLAAKSRPDASRKRHAEHTTVRRMPSPDVKWVEVDHIEPMKGHGVKFTHVAFPHRLVAFIDGFGWLHKPGTPATVEILRVHATGIPPAVRAMVRRKVLSVLRQRCKCRWWGFRGQIRAVVNG
jgi:hypothetical protein